ncbi:MAG: outer membrane protein assembly factor BamA [Puniceicoccales bacterium]|jgi:outer membrane protein insertion porin family|nr:outer membrane protein assembly factor BamA [Puniceicoccales bacterium]
MGLAVRIKLLWVWLLSWTALCFPVAAVGGTDLIVGDVQVRAEGGPMPINDAALSTLIKVRKGESFLQEKNDDSIRALYGTKLFDLVEVHMDGDVHDGEISLVYVLYPKARIGRVSFRGNRKLGNRQLRRAVSIDDGAALDWAQVQKDLEAIRKLYLDRGYADIAVRAVSGEERRDGTPVDLTFEISEGKRLPISRISFRGNRSISSRELARQMSTRRRTPFSLLTGTGCYKEEQINGDLETLCEYYRNRGFLDVQICPENVILERKQEKRLRVIIPIEEGQRAFVGNITFSGNEILSTRGLQKLLKIKKGEPFSPERVDKTVEAIQYAYGRNGYIDTTVRAKRRANVAEGAIDLEFIIRESGPCRVGTVQIQGNRKTKNKVILRELSLFPGDKFDLTKLRNSENRLRETRFFQQAVLIPEPTGERDVRDVLINLEEGHTGRFYIGAAMGSFDNVSAFAEFAQGNFDIGSPHTFFQGAGQKFRARVDIGTRTSQASVNFEEPWLFDRELAFGKELFLVRSGYKKGDYNYSGASYSEEHGGFEVYLRKRIWGLLEGKLYYRLDRARVYDVEPYAPDPLKRQAAEGLQWISKGGFLLERDSRDSLLYPTVGNRIFCEVDYAGLGGDVHYVNFSLQAGQWVPIWRSFLCQTFCLIGKLGTMKGLRGHEVPYFDRTFLGGPADMRGFDIQAVGPRDYRYVPVGSLSYAYGCAEYCFRLMDQLRLVLFTDGAYTGTRFGHLDDPFYWDAGVELRLFVMGSPLRLIFGWPLQGDPRREREMNFNFTFGTIF